MKINLILPVFVLLALIIGSAFAEETNSDNLTINATSNSTGSALYEEGLAAIDEENYEKAISVLKEAVAEDPEYADAWFKLGSAYFLSGDLANSFDSYTKVTEISPDYGKAWSQLGFLSLFYSDPINPTYALEAYENATRLTPDDPAILTNKGICYLLLNETERSDETFDEALSLDESNPRALYWKALTTSDSGDLEKGLEYLNTATEVKPDYKDAWYAKGDIELQLGKNEEAKNSLDTALGIEGDFVEPLNAGILSDSDIYYRLGVIDYGNDALDDAKTNFDKALEINPDNHNSLYYKGLIQFVNEDREGALESFTKSIELKEDFARAWYWKGRVELGNQDYENAVKSLNTAIELDEGLIDAWYYLGGTLSDAGEYEAAVLAFDRVTEASPEYADAWYLKGVSLYQTQLYEDTINSLEQAVTLPSETMTDDNKANAYHIIGLSKLILDDTEGAAEALSESVTLNATNSAAWNDYGSTLNDLKKYEEGLSAFEKAIELDDTSAEYYLNSGNVLRNLERYEEAIKDIDKAIEIDPVPRAYNAKGLSLMKLNKNEEAVEVFDEGIAKDSSVADLYANRAVAYSNLKQYDEALASIDEALALDSTWESGLAIKQQIEDLIAGAESGEESNTTLNMTVDDNEIVSNETLTNTTVSNLTTDKTK